MYKFIFLFFLLFTSLNSFCQESFSADKKPKSVVINKKIKAKKEKIKVINETDVDLLLNNNLCEILSIKPSDLLNEKMLKKLKANV